MQGVLDFYVIFVAPSAHFSTLILQRSNFSLTSLVIVMIGNEKFYQEKRDEKKRERTEIG